MGFENKILLKFWIWESVKKWEERIKKVSEKIKKLIKKIIIENSV